MKWAFSAFIFYNICIGFRIKRIWKSKDRDSIVSPRYSGLVIVHFVSLRQKMSLNSDYRGLSVKPKRNKRVYTQLYLPFHHRGFGITITTGGGRKCPPLRNRSKRGKNVYKLVILHVLLHVLHKKGEVLESLFCLWYPLLGDPIWVILGS